MALCKRHVFFFRTVNERASNGNFFVTAVLSRLRTLADKHVYTGLFTLCVCVCVFCIGRWSGGLMCLCLLL